jgi:acyl-CoA thioester hydrolase
MKLPNFVAETTFHVRYVETDAQGVVNHAHYVSYLEEGRSDYLRQRGTSYADFEREGYFLAVTEIQIRYAQAARYDDLLTIRTWVNEIRSRSLVFQYEVLNSPTRTVLTTATTRHLCLNRSGQVAKIPVTWLQWVE